VPPPPEISPTVIATIAVTNLPTAPPVTVTQRPTAAPPPPPNPTNATGNTPPGTAGTPYTPPAATETKPNGSGVPGYDALKPHM
jgi:hypothetical protein